MADEQTQVGTPATEGAQPLGGGSTGAPSQPPETKTPPAYLTREDLDAFAQSIGTRFATRDELGRATEQAAQKASDRRFETLMKKLAPELRGIDAAVKMGRMTPEDGRAAKAEMLAEATSQMPDEPEPTPQRQALPPTSGDTAETRVEAARVAAGVEWAELGFAPGTNVTEREALARITKVAAEKRAAQLVEKQKAERLKEYEAKAKTADE